MLESYSMGRVSVLQDGKSSGDGLYNHMTVTLLNCTRKNGLRWQILCICYHNLNFLKNEMTGGS